MGLFHTVETDCEQILSSSPYGEKQEVLPNNYHDFGLNYLWSQAAVTGKVSITEPCFRGGTWGYPNTRHKKGNRL